MKKVIILMVLSFVVFSCSKTKETNKEVSTIDQLVDSLGSDSLTMIEKVEQALSKSSDLDKKIEKKVVDVKVLTKEKKELVLEKEELVSENTTLKVELNTAKDSLASVTEQLIKSKVKVAKKQGFFGKLIGKKPDSVEVEKVDTIK